MFDACLRRRGAVSSLAMQNVLSAVRIALATLAFTELASVLARLRHREARREAGWFAALLVAFAARLLAPRGTPGDVLLPAAVLLCTTNLLLAVNQRRGAAAWTAAFAAVGIVFAVGALGLPGIVGAPAVGAAVLGLLSLPPFALLVLLRRKTGEVGDLILLALAVAWDVACGSEYVGLIPSGVSDALLAPLLVLLGFMLFEQGYLSPLTSSGYVDRLAAQRRLMRKTYARLLESENALVIQDRLIAAGLLSLGLAHEFKNVLSAVRTTAEHGRARAAAAEKDACLQLVLEHAASGGASATDFLERIGREGREEPRRLAARELLENLGRVARPTWRPAGITLAVECSDDIVFTGRRLEIQQILLNLLRNSADAFTRREGSTPREVRMWVRPAARGVEISVIDTAGGVPLGQREALFTMGSSDWGSTGIGLYLARNLAERNGGTLSYHPTEEGSAFTLLLPDSEANGKARAAPRAGDLPGTWRGQ